MSDDKNYSFFNPLMRPPKSDFSFYASSNGVLKPPSAKAEEKKAAEPKPEAPFRTHANSNKPQFNR